MFTSAIGRGRFFAYSTVLFIAEAVAAILCIMGTMGIAGLAESTPGLSREPLSLAILIVSIVFVVLRANLAWRRTRDAQGSKWILGMYVVFSAMFALLQAATFLVYDFGGDDSSLGLDLLGLALIGIWLRILVAPSIGGSWDSDSFAASVEADFNPRHSNADGRQASPPAAQAVAAVPTARSVAKGQRGGGFGRRGLV